MFVSTRGRYALRVMIDLAENQGDGYLPLKEIAQRQEISEKYLESILKTLVQNKFLTGLRGKGGGYRLTRRPDQYTVGSFAAVSCLTGEEQGCARMGQCRTLPMWQELDRRVNEYLDSVTLLDLAFPPQPGNDYVI